MDPDDYMMDYVLNPHHPEWQPRSRRSAKKSRKSKQTPALGRRASSTSKTRKRS